MQYDSVIIGGGPAGMAAAVYFARQKMKFALISENIGGQALMSADVENYLGFHLMDGVALIEKFKEHLNDYKKDFDLIEGERVTALSVINGGFSVKTSKDRIIETRTVLITTGEKHRELGVPGEKAFYGRGVTYCATCDAPLYGGKDVAIVGGGNSAMQAVLFLEKYAKSMTVFTVNEGLTGDAIMLKKIQQSEKVRVIGKSKITKILGDAFVSGLEYEDRDGKKQLLETQGVFIEIGLVAECDFTQLLKKNKKGEIEVTIHNETNIPGIWSAGDVTNVTEKQIAVAVGEGSKASLNIIQWLQQHEG
ncbi:MAG: FAD-dependent oxidoreductase [Patescibacteria group bacterium]